MDMETNTTIVSPHTGRTIGESAEVVPAPRAVTPDPETVWVRIRPSIRPGMDYDLCSYPADWLRHG